uniref:Uncharacterized protein n=1 Tax=Physcomitrium patens TaxID=3218 RepID=A0A2K1I9Z3_PHYPA|nr:hypothetical protein PHYPA_031141 [Physcomitrium patens]
MSSIPVLNQPSFLNQYLISSPHSPFSLFPSSYFPQCFLISPSSCTFQLKGGARLMRFASNVVIVMDGYVVENPCKLCASQHDDGHSIVARNLDATTKMMKITTTTTTIKCNHC